MRKIFFSQWSKKLFLRYDNNVVKWFQERLEEEAKKEKERRAKEAAEAEQQRKLNLTEADFKDDPRGLSEWLKEKGNTSYKNKQFDEAIAFYTKVHMNSVKKFLIENKLFVSGPGRWSNECRCLN